MALPLPTPGDANAYAAKGQELLQQAASAASGDTAAEGALISEGVTVLTAAGAGSPLATVAVDILGGAVSGFAMGGPVGALGGALAGMGAAASTLGGGGGPMTMSPATLSVQARLLAWSRSLPLHDFEVNPATGEPNPMGWALYDWIAQEANRPRSGFGVATPWHWLFWDGIMHGKFGVLWNGSFAENGDDPSVKARYRQHVLSTIKTLPGMSTEESLAHAIARAPSSELYDVFPGQTAGHITGSAKAPLSLFLLIGGPLPFPIPDGNKSDAFLGMATVMGMLAMGALNRSIASELLMQREIFSTLDRGYSPSLNASQLLDQYVTLAHGEPEPMPKLDPVLLGHIAGKLGVAPTPKLVIPPSVLSGIAPAVLEDWTAYYLGEKGAPV